MSRHTVKRRGGSAVIGFDRPLQNFFVQTWSRSQNMTGTYTCYDIEQLKPLAERLKLTVPPALWVQMEKEAAGQADTNTCKDWR